MLLTFLCFTLRFKVKIVVLWYVVTAVSDESAVFIFSVGGRRHQIAPKRQ